MSKSKVTNPHRPYLPKCLLCNRRIYLAKLWFKKMKAYTCKCGVRYDRNFIVESTWDMWDAIRRNRLYSFSTVGNIPLLLANVDHTGGWR